VINSLRAQFDDDSDVTINITPKRHAIPIRDTKLSQHRETTAIAQSMPAIALEEALTSFIISKQKSAIRPLSRMKQTDRAGVFPAAGLAAHALSKLMFYDQISIYMRTILAAYVAMNYHVLGEPLAKQGHIQRITG
jgi:hypothetical protein